MKSLRSVVLGVFRTFLGIRSWFVQLYVRQFKLKKETFPWKTGNRTYEVKFPHEELEIAWVHRLTGGLRDYDLQREIVLSSGIKNPNIIVVGSNMGLSEIALSQIPGSHICGFEPVPSTYEFARENIASNGINNVEIINMGMSSASGTMPVGIGTDSGSSSVNFKSAGEVVECSFETLDGFINKRGLERIAYLKIDAEGQDIEVRKGGTKIIRAPRIMPHLGDGRLVQA